MADKKLIAIHHVPFLVNNFSTKLNKLAIFRQSLFFGTF